MRPHSSGNVVPMPTPSALVCVRCATAFSVDSYAQDCAACRAKGAPANLTVTYSGTPGAGASKEEIRGNRGSMWRWDAFLHASSADAVTLGEGNTPLLPAPALGLGDVWIKDESRNPTWSFKDRLGSGALTMAKRFGAKVIASSSSGNAGAAAAAYAAKAGIPCVVFTFVGSAGPLVLQMRAYGAMVVKVNDKADRWRLQSLGVKEFGWYPTSPFFGPVVGSNPYGMEGYKTIAYEVAEAFDWQPPDWCVLPVCYGDALYGMWKGFEDLKALGWIDRVPRFVAAEVSGSLTQGMASGDAARGRPQRAVDRHVHRRGAGHGTGPRCIAPLQRSCRDDRRRRSAALGRHARRQGRHLARGLVGGALCRDRTPAGRRHDQAARALRCSADRRRPQGSRSDRAGAARAAAGDRRSSRTSRRAQEFLRIHLWLSWFPIWASQ